VFILHLHIAGNATDADIFRAGTQVQRPDNIRGLEIARLQIEVDVKTREAPTAARALEIDCLGNAREPHPVSKISVEPHSSFYVFERAVLGAPLDDDVVTNLRESSGT